MSVQTQIDRIKNNVQSAINAAKDKGAAAPQHSNSDSLAEMISKIPNYKKYSNLTIPPSAFSLFDTKSDYPYTAKVAISGITAEHFAVVMFANGKDILSNICETGAGYVAVFSMEIPKETINIFSITLM